MSQTIKERLIDKSITILERKIKSIRNILDSNPLSDIFKLRKDFQELLKKHDNDIHNKEISEFINIASKKEKELFALARKQSNTSQLISDLVRYESELSELRNESILAGIRNERKEKAIH